MRISYHPLARFFPALLVGSLFIIAAITLVAFQREVRSSPANVTFPQGEKSAVSVSLPLDIPDAPSAYQVAFTLEHHGWITRLAFSVDDCLESLQVNGVLIADPRLPHCDWDRPILLELGKNLHEGSNFIVVKARNTQGGAGLRVHYDLSDPLMLIELFVLAGFFIILVLAFLPGRLRFLDGVVIWVLVGCALRFIYCCLTEYEVRSYDWWGHLEYLIYVSENHRIPPQDLGWEAHQPPLYYAIAAPVFAAAQWFSHSVTFCTKILQALSCLLSCLTLLVGAWISYLVFPSDSKHRAYLTGVLAVFPGVVFFSSRLSNDALQQLLAFLTLAVALRWWQGARHSALFCGTLIIALGVLTKLSELVWVPFAVLLVLLKPGLTWGRRLSLIASCAVLFLLFTAWYAWFRFYGGGAPSLVSTAQFLAEGLRVSLRWQDFVSFNALEVLKIPFNGTWDPLSRREFFWEFLFRSAFFGEFSFVRSGNFVIKGLLASGMLLLLYLPFGICAAVEEKKWTWFPLLLSICTLLGALVAYRINYPYSANQDFRFISLLILPVSVFVIDGIRSLPAVFAKAGYTLIFVIQGLCLWFFGTIFFQPYG